MAREAGRRYWDEQLETLPNERRMQLREHRLHWQVRRCWDGSPFYRARLESAGLNPTTFDGPRAWRRFPILRANDLPTSGWSVAPEPWWQGSEEFHGNARRVLTDGDLVHRADLAARALWAAGARPDGTVTLLNEPDEQVQAGLGRIGARFQVGRSTQHVVFPLLPYVTTIVMHTCEADDGLHLADDHFLIEVVDPASGEPVSIGMTGALVVTDLTREGSPLLRFWAGLETALTNEPCPCGRTSQCTAFVRPLV